MLRCNLGCWFASLLVGAASVLQAESLTPLAYAPAPVDNPLKGFVPYDTSSEQANFPHSLEWFYLPLAALMTGPDTFDWKPLEQHLTAIAARGHQAVMRVYLDYPRQAPGTPKFLLDEGVPARPYNYARNNGRSVSPDYEDPRLRTALRQFVAAFGERYDGDPRLAFITVGLLGYWGEWHTSDHKEWFASKAVQREVMDAYERAFHRTRLLLRYPAGPDDPYYADNHGRPMGYHDDSFAWATMPTGKSASWYFLDRMTRAGALEKWRTQPIGGEVRPEVWDTLWNVPTGAPKGQEYDACVTATHATWLMNTGAFRSTLTGDRRERALAGARRLGYEFYVSAAAVTASAEAVTVNIAIRNTGVAPFYYRWPVELALQPVGGDVQRPTTTGWDVTRVEPAEGDVVFAASLPKPHEGKGRYRVLLRVPNVLADAPPLRFANQAQDADIAGWLTLGTVEY